MTRPKEWTLPTENPANWSGVMLFEELYAGLWEKRAGDAPPSMMPRMVFHDCQEILLYQGRIIRKTTQQRPDLPDWISHINFDYRIVAK